MLDEHDEVERAVTALAQLRLAEAAMMALRQQLPPVYAEQHLTHLNGCSAAIHQMRWEMELELRRLRKRAAKAVDELVATSVEDARFQASRPLRAICAEPAPTFSRRAEVVEIDL